MRGRDPAGRLRELFPLPFVAVVVLMLILIALTPNLLSLGSPAAGTLETEAELLVYVPPGSNHTQLTVEGIGTVVYTSITVALAPTGPRAPVPTNLTYTNRTTWNATLVGVVTAPTNPIAVNVSATYTDPSGTVVDYVGLYWFNVTGPDLLTTSYLPAPATTSTTPLSDLPITFFLVATTPTGRAA